MGPQEQVLRAFGAQDDKPRFVFFK